MRYIRYAILAALLAVFVTMALANRELVTLHLLPDAVARLTGWSFAVTLPLFVVIAGGVLFGLLVGFFWEWMREHKHRSAAVANKFEKEKLAREVSKLKTDKAKNEGDEVLALLEH